MAQQFFGDSHLAEKVAESVNLSTNDPVPLGMTITIKSLFAFQNKNWYGVYAMYDESTIIGGYYPDIPVPYHRPPKQHHSVFDEILETAVFVAVMVVVTYFTAGTGDGPAAEFMLGVLGGAVGGAAGSIAEQETARALGDQKGMNWNAVGDAALTGAIMGGIGVEVNGLQAVKGATFAVKFGMTLARGEIAALSSEGLEYAFGITKHFKWSDVVATAASAAVQSSTQAAFGDVSTRSFTQDLYASTIDSVGNAVIGKIVYGEGINMGMVTADSLGTAVGEYVGTKVTETKIAREAKKKLDDKVNGWFASKKSAQPSVRSTRGSQLPKSAANDVCYYNKGDDNSRSYWDGQDPSTDSSDQSQSSSQSPTSKRDSQSQSAQSKADQWNAQKAQLDWQTKAMQGQAESDLLLGAAKEIYNLGADFAKAALFASRMTPFGVVDGAITSMTGKSIADRIPVLTPQGIQQMFGADIAYVGSLFFGAESLAGNVASLFKGAEKTLQFDLSPRVETQLEDSRLGDLAGKLDINSLNKLADNPDAQFLYDSETGHINVVQNIEGKLLRITVPRDTFKIISVGPIQERNLTNSIANGRFIPIGKQFEEASQIDEYIERFQL